MRIANLLSLPQFELDGYRVTYKTLKECVVHAENGTGIFFQRDTGLYNLILYINICKIQVGFSILQTVSNNFKGFTKKQIEKTTLAREVQEMI